MDQTEQMESEVPTDAPPARWGGRRRRGYAAIAILAVVALGVWWFALRDDGSASVTTTTTRELVTVTRGPLTDTVTADGTAAAQQTDDLSFGASGTVTAVNVSAGDRVTAGQVLATLDSADLESDLASAQSDLADAEATLADDQASGASSTQISVDESRVRTAQDAVTDAEEALAGATLVATFDGTVASVDVTVGEQLGSSGTGGTDMTGSNTGTGQSSSTLGSSSAALPGASGGSSDTSSTADIQVVSTGRYSAELMIDSADIDRVTVGAAVTVSVSTGSSSGFPSGFPGGFPGAATGNATGGAGGGNAGDTGAAAGDTSAATGTTATGTVTEVGRVADASSGVAQYPVSIEFATDDSAFSIGTSISGAITVTVEDDVVQVPLRAVTTDSGASTVEVALAGTANGKTEIRTVTTGASAGGQIEITEGLDEGEQVVVENVVITGGGSDGGEGGFPGGGQLPSGGQIPGGGQLPSGFQIPTGGGAGR